MDTKQAQELIRQLFTHAFDLDRYRHFLRNLLNQFEPRDGHYTGNYIPDAFKQHVNQYWRIGKYADPDGHELDLLVVEVKSLGKLERARSALRNFAVDRLKKFEKEASLIAFYAQDDNGEDWRFSFVKIEHEAYRDDKGKVKLKQELTPAKRYSYLVGIHEDSHTACKQLLPVLPVLAMDYADPRINEIEAAFSIEKVTGEFFDQYKSLFVKLAEQLRSQSFFQRSSEEETDQAVNRFAKKLLGQIVFLYFLQKKGWLGVEKDKAWGTGPKRFMRERYDQIAGQGGNYYRDFLQYLFYEALADERNNQADPGYYQRFDCRVPFLNGGLFEAEYDWQHQSIELPNTLFHNEEKNKAGDEGSGILDVFGRYNFTIKEDEPLDKEVAVDPEMLGKVFENMLEVAERKSKGAFYTPREIVHYMCQESLINYLHTELQREQSASQAEQQTLFDAGNGGDQVSREDLDTLIRKGHLFVENDEAAIEALQRIEQGQQKTTGKKVELPESIKRNATLLDDKLATIKVCDPAIGSGAFPVGLLHEIVTARLALAPHSGNHQTPYQLKRHAIAESIYGVDIDPSAIDIARLRLWLSLIVDEEDYGAIEALPNLDYKIMQGNSLVEEYWGVTLFNEEYIQEDDRNAAKRARLQERRRALDAEYLALHQANQLTPGKKQFFIKETKELEKEIKKLKTSTVKDPRQGLFDVVSEAKRKARQLAQLHKDFFSASSPTKKQEIRQRITALEWELIEATLTERNQTDSLVQLAEVKKNQEKPFFLWKLNFAEVFKENGGFDVVIGNPPYIRADRSEEHSELRKTIIDTKQYETLWERWDIYIPFIEKGYKLLKDSGITSMIVSDAYCHAKYAQKSQKWFLKNSKILRLDFFSDIQLFDAGVRNIIYFFKKEDGAHNKPERCVHTAQFGNVTYLSTNEQRLLDCRAFFPAKTDLREKYKNTISLSRICYISFGCRPNSDEKKARGLFKVKDLLAQKKDETHPKPYIEAKDIGRWVYNQYRWLEWGTDRSPALLARPTFEELYEVKEKIVVADVSGTVNRAAYDSDKVYHNHTLISVVPWHGLSGIVNNSIGKTARYKYDESIQIGLPNRIELEELSRNFSVKFLLAVLNSTVVHEFMHTNRRSNIHLYPDDWKQVPIPNISNEEQNPFHYIVDYLLTAKVVNSLKLQSAFFEQLIDGLVYELYFPAEIKAAGKELLPHLGELTPLTDDMPSEEKLAVIQRQFDRLYDPRHPVRNHLETLDSVEVVRTIREALHK